MYDELTVYENLRLYAQLYRVKDWHDRLSALMSLTNLGERLHHRAGSLSKGMKQKLALARALLAEPSFLILDEPTAGLDPIFQRGMLDLIHDLNRSGRTIRCPHITCMRPRTSVRVLRFCAKGGCSEFTPYPKC